MLKFLLLMLIVLASLFAFGYGGDLAKGRTLNALHACRPNHPNNNSWQWRNAYALACQDFGITLEAIAWLRCQAEQEALNN